MADELAGKFTGTVLICGSAPCLYLDFDKAETARPDALVIALNDAARAVNSQFLVSLHHEKMKHFRAASLNRQITTLSGAPIHAGSDVDCWMTDCNSGGTSAGSAIKIARKMGFSEIILCGCPMEAGDGYFYEKYRPPVPKFQPARLGHLPKESARIRMHQEYLMRELQGDDVRSMSGFTSRLFGRPDFAEAA